MNKQIQLLAEQAGISLNQKDYSYYWVESAEDIEKFAELIIQKCIEQASIGNGHGNNQWDRALTFAAKNIKEHFGVEE